MKELIDLLRSREFEIYEINEPVHNPENITRCIGKDPVIGYCEIDVFHERNMFKISKMIGDVRIGYAHTVSKMDLEYLGISHILSECVEQMKSTLKE